MIEKLKLSKLINLLTTIETLLYQMKQSPVTHQSQQKIVAHLKSLSYLLDEAINIPGTKYRIGIDPLLGLLPAAGDYLGAIMSGYILFQSARLGTNKATLSRMAINILTEMVMGIFPVFGDIFDAGWKANKKNLALLNLHLSQPQKSEKKDLWFVMFLLAILFSMLIITTLITIISLKFIWSVLFPNFSS